MSTGYHRGIDWDAVHDLGMVPDAEIARRFGVAEPTVASARKVRMIEPANQNILARHRDVDWGSQPLGEVTDAEIARAIGCSKSTVNRERRIRGIPALHKNKASRVPDVDWGNVPELGNAPDGVVAEMYGVSTVSVCNHRTLRGIAPFTTPLGVDWDNVPELGAWPDAWVAEKYGVSPGTVSQARMCRGIQPACPEFARKVTAWGVISRRGGNR
jgi:hypothetical protein